MKLVETPFRGLFVLEPAVLNDSRGYFMETYNKRVFAGIGLNMEFVQDNESRSMRGVLRGLHYQAGEHAQTKLVRVLSGEILDVAVDLRKDEPTFGKYFSVVLSSENKKQLLIPKGFAHGLLVVSEHAEVLYKCDKFYNRESETGICFDDPELAINWGVPHSEIILSEKDRRQPRFENANFTFS